MRILPAQAKDHTLAAELIFSSGTNSLNALFFHPEFPRPTDFIAHAFAQPEGQFSFSQHVLLKSSEQIIGLGSSWTNQPSSALKQATLQILLDYFGAPATAQILENSKEIERIIPSPADQHLCVGHLAIIESRRGEQLINRLLDFFLQQAENLGKKYLVLDVEEQNHSAIKAYERYGFTVTQMASPSARGREIGLTPHCHMQISV